MSDIQKAIIVAVARHNVIGRDGDMPWRLRTDLQRFKALTLGKPVIMGRKTYASIGRPLPGRANIIVSRQNNLDHPDLHLASSLPDAFSQAETWARNADVQEICIIGGGEIYAQSMEIADKLYVTHVEKDVEGDTFFPEIDPNQWTPGHELAVPAGENDSDATRFVVYERR